MDILINIEYKKLPATKWSDSQKRSEHVSERLELRGISVSNIKEAVQRGRKVIRDDGSIVAEFRWYRVVYREFQVGNFRKIYPITVIEI